LFPIEDFETERNYDREEIALITVGRISEVKQINVMIEVLDRLRTIGKPATLTIVGDALTRADKKYGQKLEELIREKNLQDFVSFTGAVPNREVSLYYARATLFINLSKTGSLDKAILEAMATGLAVTTSNEALIPMIDGRYTTTNEPVDIAKHILALQRVDASDLKAYVHQNHGLHNLINRLITEME